MIELTQEYVLELFNYENGNLYWKIDRYANKVFGKKAGSLKPDGYTNVKINKKMYRLHRLIFLYHNGYLPKEVDHIDGNPFNNKVDNLRASSKSQNQCNRKINSNSSTGYKNIWFNKINRTYRVSISKDKNSYSKDGFKTLGFALEYAEKLRKELHGEFARSI